MRHEILALVEDNIATTFLLATRLGEIGHPVEVVSDVEAFKHRLTEGEFGWLLLDADVVRRAGADLVEAVRSLRGHAKVVWLGRRLEGGALPISARFSKPLSYAELSRYFSTRGLAERPSSRSRRRK